MSESYQSESTNLVSVIITTYGDATPLSHAIESVLNQSYANLELVVVDDNGKDSLMQLKTESVVAPYLKDNRLRYVVHDINRNGAAARNTGIHNTRGEYITFLDNDDLMLPRRIESAVEALRRSDADACFADVLVVKEKFVVNLINVRLSGFCWKEPLSLDGCMGTGSNLFLTRRGVSQTGDFDVSFERNQDVEYMIRYLTRFQAVSTGRLSLIKGESGTDNAPSFVKMKRTKKQLASVFAKSIADLDSSELLAYEVGREESLLYAAKNSGDKDGVRETLGNLKRLNVHVGPSRYFDCYFRVYFQGLSRYIRSAVRRKKHVEIMKKLDQEVIALLSS